MPDSYLTARSIYFIFFSYRIFLLFRTFYYYSSIKGQSSASKPSHPFPPLQPTNSHRQRRHCYKHAGLVPGAFANNYCGMRVKASSRRTGQCCWRRTQLAVLSIARWNWWRRSRVGGRSPDGTAWRTRREASAKGTNRAAFRRAWRATFLRTR